MKFNFKRLLNVFLALCMTIVLIPGTVRHAHAVESNYSFDLNISGLSVNELLVGGQIAEGNPELRDWSNDGEIISNYELSATITDNAGNPTDVVDVTINGTQFVITSNTDGKLGEANIYFTASIAGVEVANNTACIFVVDKLIVSPTKYYDEFGNDINPSFGEVVALEEYIVNNSYLRKYENGTIVDTQIRDITSGYTFNVDYYDQSQWEMVNTQKFEFKRITKSFTSLSYRIGAEGASKSLIVSFDNVELLNWDWYTMPSQISTAGTANVCINLQPLQFLDNYELKFYVGNGEKEWFTPFADQTDLFEILTTGQGQVEGIRLNGAAIKAQTEIMTFFVRAELVYNGQVIDSIDKEMAFFNPYTYSVYDTTIFQTSGFDLPTTVQCNIEGYDFVEVTNITSNNDHVEIYHNEEFNSYIMTGKSAGESIITVTHKTVDGGTSDITFKVTVIDFQWNFDIENLDGRTDVLPAESVNYKVNVSFTGINGDGEMITVDKDMDIEWSLVDPSLANYVTLVPNGNSVAITVSEDILDHVSGFEIKIDAYELDENGNRYHNTPNCSTTHYTWIAGGRTEFVVDGYNADLPLGESMTITPSLVYKTYNETTKQFEYEDIKINSISYEFDNWGLEVVDNGNSSYTLKHLSKDETWMNFTINYTLHGEIYETYENVKINEDTTDYSFIQWKGLDNDTLIINGDERINNFYFDETKLATLINDYPGYDVEFEVGYMFDGWFEGQGFGMGTEEIMQTLRDTNGNPIGICLNGTLLYDFIRHEGVDVLKATVKIPANNDDGYTILQEYYVNMDATKTYYYDNNNADYLISFGEEVSTTIWTSEDKEVNVLDVTASNDNVTIEKNDWCWYIETQKVGETEITIKHETIDGGVKEYTYTITIIDSEIQFDSWLVGKDIILPGQSSTIEVVAIEKYYDYDAKEIKTRDLDSSYELSVDICGTGGLDYDKITFEADGNNQWTLSVGKDALLDDWDNGEVGISTVLYHGGCNDYGCGWGPINERTINIHVRKEYEEFVLDGFDPTINLGESTTFTPVAKKYYLDADGNVAESIVRKVEIEFVEQDPKMFEITESNGTFTLKRVSLWDNSIGYYIHDSEYGEWDCYWLEFTPYDYTVRFKDLTNPEWDMTEMNLSNEAFKLETNLSHIDPNDLQYLDFEWDLSVWVDALEDSVDINKDIYTVSEDKQSIIINGPKLAKQLEEIGGVDTIYLVVWSKYKGMDALGWGVDIECIDDLKPEIYLVEDGKEYCGATTVQVDEGVELYVNGKKVELNADNQHVLLAKDADYEIKAVKLANGKETVINVKVHEKHNFVLDKTTVIEPTCTTKGYTGNANCSVCGEFSQGTAINTLEHTHVLDKTTVKEATHTAEGYTGDKVCTCGDKVLGQKIAKTTTHTHVLDKTTVKATTCTTDGYTGDKKCECGDIIKGEVVKATGHKHVLDETTVIKPTCTTKGYAGDSICSVCGDVVKGKEINPRHSYVDGKCSVCGETDPLIYVEVNELPTIDITEPVEEVVVGTEEDAKEVLTETTQEILEKVEKGEETPEITEELAMVINVAISTGNNVDLVTDVVVEKLPLSAVPEKTVEMIVQTNKEANVVEYLDLSVYLNVVVNDEVKGTSNVTELTKPMKFTIAIPEELQSTEDGYQRRYFVIREHNGKTDMLPVKVNNDGTLTFQTNKFSTYALAYVDEKIEDIKPEIDTEVKPESPETSDTSYVTLFTLLTFLSAAILVVLKKKEELSK